MNRPAPKVLVAGIDSADEVLSIPRLVARGLPGAAVVRVVETHAALVAALANDRFDAVVIDCDLPGLHPSELGPAFDAAGEASHVPVVLMSWGVGEVAAVAALRAGARDWVLKSEIQRLVPALTDVLARAQSEAPPPSDAFGDVVAALDTLVERTSRLKLGEGHELARQLRQLTALVERVRPPPARRVRARARPGAAQGARR